MNFRNVLASLLSISAISLVSCSGPKNSTPPPGGGGTTTLSLTLTAAPLTPPPNTNLLSFIVDVNTITLTSSTGTNVNIPLNATSFSVDLTKLQSDSAFLGTLATVPAGSYASITVSLSNPVVTFCTQTASNTGCAFGSVTKISGAAAAPKITTTPFPLTISANQKIGLAINFNPANALTVNTSQVVTAVNLAASNVLSASALPPAASSLATGQLDFVGDVTGVVTAVNTATPSVTVQTATGGSLTAIANSSTIFSPNCTTFNLSLTFSSCVVKGDVASLDMALNSDGTLTLVEYDPLETTTGDWIEGIITSTPSSTTQFQLVANNLVLSTTSSLIGSALPLGSPVNITIPTSPQPQPFAVDTKGFVVPSADPFTNRTDTSALVPGQTVAARVTAFTAASGATLATASTNFLFLRFTRVTGSVASVAPPNTFTIQSLPTFFGLTTPVTVQLSTGSPSTIFDGVTSSSNLTVGQTVSINALYFGPPVGLTSTPTPFSAAKVRVP